MCGFIVLLGQSVDQRFQSGLLKHRGPDHTGSWYSDNGEYPASISHLRLSIIDKSDSANQPILSDDGRFVLVFNGEIYNYIELRDEMKSNGVIFKTNSDTEVFFKGILTEGLNFQNKCNGMWAFVLWDRHSNTAKFGRDRFGKKPLFYLPIGNEGILFASEMKAIYPYLDRVVPHSRIEHFFRNPFDYEHTEECSISGIRRVLSGHYGQWKSGKLKLTRWWNTLDHLVTVPNSYSDQVDCFREIFLDAVRIRMRSDVPIGTALSGGLDSSAVFCAMYHLISNGKFESSNAPQAFTAHYPNSDLDETKWAKFVTEYLNVPLNQVTIDPSTSAWNLIDSIKQVEDPYITLPIPMLSTYQAIKKSGITVTLDGHGADELFSGYNDIYLNMISSSVDRTSELLAISKSLSSGNYHLDDSKLNLYWNKFLSLTKYVGKKSRSFLWKDYVNRYSDFNHLEYKKMSLFDRRLYEIFHVTILPTLLRNYDRYSMANGVEVRMPFMDYRLVTYCFSLPVESKLGGGYTKRILRDAMRGIVPNEILDRRDKVGWNAPLHEWLCGPLSNEIDILISTSTNIRPTVRRDWKRFKENTQRSFQDGQKIWAELQPKIWLDICDSIK